MKKAQGKIEFVFILIVIALLASVIFLPQLSQLTGFATAGQENLVTIEKNKVTAINLSTYVPGVERTYLATSPSNIDVQIKGTLLIMTPDKDFTGERILKVFVADQEIQEMVFRVEVVGKKNPILEKIKEEYEEKEEPIYIPPPEPEPEQEPEDVIPSNKLFVTEKQKLHVNLSSYFETPGPYVATGDIDLIVDIESDLMTIAPYPGFVGKETITVSSIGDVLEEHAFLVTVLGEGEEPEQEAPEEEAVAPKNVSEEDDITFNSKKYGEKIEDEPEFEVYFKSIEKDNETVEIIFYHDSNESEKVYVEGDVNYTLSANSSVSFESVNLTVVLDDGIVPEFELHVGDTSEKFKFGKKIPKVWLEGKQIKKAKKKEGNQTSWYKVIDRDDDLVNVLIVNGDSSVLIKGVRVEKIKALFRWIKASILTTEIFAADPIEMEEAIISLPRT
ncbi:hypothetical protein KY310_03230, partial [Candidatus Woesearchaeota archaeon]|nr:hypothetical protein [Candidatus Woesearchaeota archaeon]